MVHSARFAKMSCYDNGDITSYKIYWDTEDRNYRMRVKCDNCPEEQCRCFEDIEDAMFFEGYLCSERCFVLALQGEDEHLDEIVLGMNLTIPLKDAPDSVIEEILLLFYNNDTDNCEMSVGEMCPI